MARPTGCAHRNLFCEFLVWLSNYFPTGSLPPNLEPTLLTLDTSLSPTLLVAMVAELSCSLSASRWKTPLPSYLAGVSSSRKDFN